MTLTEISGIGKLTVGVMGSASAAGIVMTRVITGMTVAVTTEDDSGIVVIGAADVCAGWIARLHPPTAKIRAIKPRHATPRNRMIAALPCSFLLDIVS
jgi:hypothetical protein